jgi:hypothetical protein
VLIESRVREPIGQEFSAKGHRLQVVHPYSMQMGRENGVLRDAHGINYGGSDSASRRGGDSTSAVTGHSLPMTTGFRHEMNGKVSVI